MKITLTGRSLPVNLLASGVMALLLLSSCGSKEFTYMKAGPFEYLEEEETMPRIVIVHTRVFGGELSYHEQMKLPVFRFGLIDSMFMTDVKSTVVKLTSYITVPFLFASSNTYHTMPTNVYDVNFFYKEQESTFDPNEEARLPLVDLPGDDMIGSLTIEEAELLFDPSVEAIE